MSRVALLLVAVAVLAACSPVYVAQSAAGHAGLLARRRSISKALQDPGTPAALRGPLETAHDARRFAFETMGLPRSSDYETYVPVEGGAVTWLVSASRRTKLEPYRWRFPLAGSFPYKGYFKKERALAERDRLEKKGWDACVFGASAYNTPLPISDPLPTAALERSTGALAALMIHELAHGAVDTKDMAFNESAAEFIGRRGAQEYLVERFGLGSRELREYVRELEEDAAVDAEFAALRAKLEALYAEDIPEEEKLRRRVPLFEEANKKLKLKVLNNAVVVAHQVYHDDLPFGELLRRVQGDWRKFLETLGALDRREPAKALKAVLAEPNPR